MSIKTLWYKAALLPCLGRFHDLIHTGSHFHHSRFSPWFPGVLAVFFLFSPFLSDLSRAHITEETLSLLKTSPSGGFIYTVEAGDSLWKIFSSLEKGQARWAEFLEENSHFRIPDRIFPGEEVRIPEAWLATPIPKEEVRPISSAFPREILASPRIFPPLLAKNTAGGEPEGRVVSPPVFSEAEDPVSAGMASADPEAWKISLNAFLFLIVLWILSRFYPASVSRIRWGIVALTIFLGLRYLFWRSTETLNTESVLTTVLSWGLLAAEIYGFLSVLFFYLQVAKPARREAPPLDPGNLPSVDIFVTTFNEPTDLLFRTLVACRGLDYPEDRRTVYVLDDGARQEVRRLAERLGCRYLGRSSRADAKAGNLNFGLAHSSGKLILVLDCDHVPVRSFLKETVGFFEDPKVGIVQTPHYFYNPDTFQRNLRLEDKIVNEQDLFFRIIQEGRDGFNSSFFAGSGGVFRRSSLEGIGGFQTKTLTEDLHTSMVLHARGESSVYLNRVLAAGLAPESYGSYLRQRQRWAKGGFQVFLLDNPLLRPGLSFMQRLQYFGAIFYFFHGLARLIYLAAPLSFLLFALPPLQAQWTTLLLNFIPYYFGSLLAFTLFSRGFRNPFWSDLYETAMAFSITRTFFQTLVKPRRTEFHVTPKGSRFDRAHWDWATVVPHGLLLVFILAGFAVGVYRVLAENQTPDPFIISGFWAAYNILLLLGAIVVANERPQKRFAPRLRRKISCQLTSQGESWSGTTTDLSESGLGFRVEKPVVLPPFVDVRLTSDFGEVTRLKGEVLRNDRPEGDFNAPDRENEFNVGIRFLNVSDSVQQSLIRQMFSSPSSWKETPISPSKSWGSLGLLATAVFRVFKRDRNLRRFSRRERTRLRCEVDQEGKRAEGLTEDIGNKGLSVRLPFPLETGKKVLVQIKEAGRVVFPVQGEAVRISQTVKGDWICGIRLFQTQDLGPHLLPLVARQ